MAINSGSYQILFKIKKNLEVKVGNIGLCYFLKGYYFYTGSAKKNLKQRVERHIRKDKKLYWHIDYLLSLYDVEIINIYIFPSYLSQECKKNHELLSFSGASTPCKGFGSSDCNKCPSHLIYFKYKKYFIGYLNKIRKSLFNV